MSRVVLYREFEIQASVGNLTQLDLFLNSTEPHEKQRLHKAFIAPITHIRKDWSLHCHYKLSFYYQVELVEAKDSKDGEIEEIKTKSE